MSQESNYITYRYNQEFICQMKDSGYISLNSLSRAANKQLSNFLKLKTTKEFLKFFRLYLSLIKNPLPALIELESGVLYAHPVVAIFFAQWTQTKLTIFVTSIMIEWSENQNSVDDAEINTLEKSLQKSEAKVLELQTVITQIAKVVNLNLDPGDKTLNKRGEIERLISEYALFQDITRDWAWEMIYRDFCSSEQISQNRIFYSFVTALDYLESHPKLMNQLCDFVKVYLQQKDLSSYEIITFRQETNNHHVDCF